MKKLKTSIELSQERMIIPRYTQRIYQDDFSEGDLSEKSYIPEFLEDFKIPGENKKMIKDNDNLLIDCNNIFGYDIQKEDISDVYMQEPTISNNIFGEICWNGNVSLYNGSNRAGRAIVLGLCDKNMSVKINEHNYKKAHINKTTSSYFDIMKKIDLNKPINIYHETIPKDFKFNSIFYSYFNDENDIEETISSLKCFSEIWVPSRFNKDMLTKHGIEKVHTVPLGIDLQRYTKNPTITNFSIETNKFSFLSIFNDNETIEMQTLFKAYLEEFNDKDDVSLVIISKLPFEHIERQFLLVRQTVNKNDEDLPHIVPYNNLICEKDMPTCYYKCNAVLSLASKAFGFTCLEAGGINKPIISVNKGGQMDFLNSKNCFLVDKENLLEETKKTMRYVKDNYFEALSKSEILNKIIKNNYGINKTLEIIYEKLELIKNKGEK